MLLGIFWGNLERPFDKIINLFCIDYLREFTVDYFLYLNKFLTNYTF